MAKGYLNLVLHAHLPFVRHPEEAHMLEERWLYEAITETYIPLISVFDHLVQDHVPFRLTMSMTPPLVNMLQDPLLQERYIAHLDRLIELSEKELDRTGNLPHFHGLALMYYRKFREAREVFIERYDRDLVNAFREFQDMGFLEIITCGATHGFFPLLYVNRKSVEAQVRVAVDHYQQTFGCAPKGIWLPECGFVRGVDEILADAGITYFFTDTHGLRHADPAARYGVYAPVYTPSGVAAFGRDEETSRQVWSSKEGYPGDPDYREYYKDIGFELDEQYIRPYIHPDGIRINTGIKYWRITGNDQYKEAYRPDWAQKKAILHAENFIFNRQQQIEFLSQHMDRDPVIVAPYDAELYGHWWYEGPMWIDYLVRKIAYDQDVIELSTPSDYLLTYSTNQLSVPADSTWGFQGYNAFWLDDSNHWVYRHLHRCALRMQELADKFADVLSGKRKDDLIRRVLNQAARELLLAESSDWTFIMRTGTMVSYAQRRIQSHVARFTRLYEYLMSGTLDPVWFETIEEKDNIFKSMDCARYYLSAKADNLASNNQELVHV